MNSKLEILLIEDEETHFDLIMRAFRSVSSPYRLVCAQTLADARVAISKMNPCLILSDYCLPDGDCLELLEEVHDRYPMVVMTSHGNEQAAVNILKAGAFDYIIKSPVAFGEMPRTVERALRNWQVVQDKQAAEAKLREAHEALAGLIALRTKELHQSRSDYSRLVNAANLFVVRWDKEKKVRFVNRYALETFGYTEDEFIGLSALDKDILDTDAPRIHFSQLLDNVVGGGIDSAQARIHPMLRRDKSTIWVAWTSHLIDSNSENGGEVLSIGLDVTENQMLHKELEAAKIIAENANRAKSVFLANMSHEIRTPMNAILGMVHLTLQGITDPKLQGYLHKAQDSAKVLMRLLNGILDLSRMESGKMELEEVHFDLDELLVRVGDSVLTEAHSKGLELLFDVGPEVPRSLLGDPLRLSQVLVHLLSNALKFTDSGEIKVQVNIGAQEKNQAEIHFAVHDTGIGIPEEMRSRIFLPFQQNESSTTRHYSGTGLGLSICQNLVHLMKGSIRMESTVGKGSSFFFQVTFKRDLREGNVIPDLSGLRNLRVLVIDDNHSARENMSSMLRSLHIRPTLVANGLEAIEKLAQSCQRNEPHDLIFLDWNMPQVNGVETIQRMLVDHRIAPVPPIVMLAAGVKEIHEVQTQDMNLAGILSKPFTFSQLLDVILDVKEIATPATKTSDASYQPPLQIQGAHILVVDDNEMSRQLATEVLESAGAIIRTACNGQEALDILFHNQFDLVVMDCQMPVMDGYEATRRLRKDSRTSLIPIIAMTASALMEDKARSILAGMNEHVAKPLNIQGFLEAVGRWLKYAAQSGKNNTEVHASSSAPELEIAEDSPEWILIEGGFDVRNAISRLAGDWTMYRNFLFGFIRNHVDDPDEIFAAICSNDQTKGIRLAHTLKGLAGFVGANSVSSLAKTMEDHIGILTRKELLMLNEELRLVLNRVVDVGKHYARNVASAVDERQGDEVDIEELKQLLISCDGAAVEIAEHFARTERPFAKRSVIAQQVAVYAAKYDYAKALSALEKWQSLPKENE